MLFSEVYLCVIDEFKEEKLMFEILEHKNMGALASFYFIRANQSDFFAINAKQF